MESKVHFSHFCTIITAVIIVAFVVAIATTLNDPKNCLILVSVTVLMILTGLYYCPVKVSADSEAVRIHRLMSRDKVFKYDDIQAVDTCYPSAGGIRLCGSGGFFGYWGYFSDIIIGQYFGYYADRSQCFYIRLKNKRQYVVSCRNHIEMVKFIQIIIITVRARKLSGDGSRCVKCGTRDISTPLAKLVVKNADN